MWRVQEIWNVIYDNVVRTTACDCTHRQTLCVMQHKSFKMMHSTTTTLQVLKWYFEAPPELRIVLITKACDKKGSVIYSYSSAALNVQWCKKLMLRHNR